MAKKKEASEETVPAETPKHEEPAPSSEPIYTAEDLIRNYKAFKTSKEIVVVALRLAGKETATFEEAKKIIDKFRKEEK